VINNYPISYGDTLCETKAHLNRKNLLKILLASSVVLVSNAGAPFAKEKLTPGQNQIAPTEDISRTKKTFGPMSCAASGALCSSEAVLSTQARGYTSDMWSANWSVPS
jgi:hypothetical protein